MPLIQWRNMYFEYYWAPVFSFPSCQSYVNRDVVVDGSATTVLTRLVVCFTVMIPFVQKDGRTHVEKLLHLHGDNEV